MLAVRPAPYAAWAGAVAVSLGIACRMDPYVFGFATLAAAGVTVPIGLVGVLVAIVHRRLGRGRRLAILFWVMVAAGAIVAAMATLRTFSWT